jgi:hypothetical protein
VYDDDDVVAHVLDVHDLQFVAAARPRPGGDQIDLLLAEVDVRQMNRAARIVPLEDLQQGGPVAEDVSRDARELERRCLPGEVGIRNSAWRAPATCE